MIKSADYFSLLSKLMSEDKTYKIEPDMDIEDMYNNIYTLIDTDFMTDIEKIGYPEKYEIVDSLKRILTDYKLFLYFPELIYKNLVCLYDFPKCTINILKSYGLNSVQSSIISSKPWIPNDIPTIFTAREGSWNCLNIPDVEIAITDEEYKLTQKLTNRGINAKSLITVLSAPLANCNENMAVCVVPGLSDGMTYSKALMNLSEAVVLESRSIDSFICDVKAGAFQYIKRLYCPKNVSSKKIKALSSCGLNFSIVHYADFTELLQLLNNENYLCNNIGICKRLTEMINRIIKYLAENINLEKTQKEMLTSDIFANGDENAVKCIQELKSKITNQIDTNTQLYKTMLKTRDLIVKFAEQLEGMVNKLFYYIAGLNDKELNADVMVDHYPELILLQNLFLQYLSFFRIDNSKVNKQTTTKYSQLLSKYSEEYSIVTEYCVKLYEKQNTNINSVEAFSLIDKPSIDAFMARIQIMLGTEIFSYSNDYVMKSLVAKIPLIEGNCHTPAEFYIAGKFYESTVDDVNKAISYYNISLELGNVFAGDRILALSEAHELPYSLELLAKSLVPSACYKYGMLLLNNNQTSADSILYLKIASSYGNSNAMLALAKHYYEKVKIAVSDDNIYDVNFSENCRMALSYYKALDEVSSEDHCAECGYLAYYLKDYNNAVTLLSRANDKNCYNLLGSIYEKGLGCAVDRQSALSFYSTAKDMGSTEGAANYDRLSAIIAKENRRNVASTSTNYSSYTYYSSYYSGYYSSYYSSDSGCVVQGTQILLADGSSCNIEDIKPHQEILNCNETVSYTSDEFIRNDSVEMLYAVNDDIPFMSLEHAIMTERGWCSMNPVMSMSINPNYEVRQLEIGDVFVKKVLIEGKISDIRCEVKKINVSPNVSRKPCFDLHFFDGYNSYYANGYPCLLNYPEFTLSHLKGQIQTMSKEQYAKFINMCIENRDVLEIAFGKTNISFLFSEAIDK